jgi:hexosaminidase
MKARANPPEQHHGRRVKVAIAVGAVAVTVTLSGATPSIGSPSGVPGAVPLTSVVPRPARISTATGVSFDLRSQDAIYATDGSGDARAAAEYLAGLLRKPTGYALPVRTLDPGAQPEGIVLQLGQPAAGAKAEAYQLDVTAHAVTIRAGDRAGLFNGVETLRQLLPVKVDRQQWMPGPWRIQGGRISDEPRYEYRGAMLDVARHFLPVPTVEKYIDTIARYKINYLHLHLTDDQGWRIEVKGWPELTEIGGSTGVGDMMGGYYTQADYSALVQYAWARGVTVIPEIEGPDHEHAALASYGKLNCDGKALDPYTGWVKSDQGGLCLDDPDTYALLDDVIGQLAALTPGPYIHVGGDESSDRTQAELDGYYDKVAKLVAKHGKKAFGWQEAAGSLPPASSTTELWSVGINDDQLIAAAQAGGKVVMAPANHSYLDMKYTADEPEYPIGNSWAGTSTVKNSYDWSPETQLAGLPANAVDGVEAPLFTETIFGVNQLEDLAFPRLLSIAEIGWAKASYHNWNSFKQRLAAQGPRLRESRVNYYLSPDVPWPMGS